MKRATAVVLAVLGIPDPSFAQASDLEELEQALQEDVVSGATRSAAAGSTAPATVSSITAEELRACGIRSIDEALNFLAMGMVSQDPLHSVEVGARGVLLTADFGNHVLLLLNGHPLNEPWDGTAYFERGAGIPFELIDHLEVILGPGSVLYGSNAMLGVINVVTRRAKDLPTGLLVVEGELAPAVDGADQPRAPSLGSAYLRDVGTGLRLAGGGARAFDLGGTRAEVIGELEYYTQSGPAFTFAPQFYGADAITGAPKRFSSDGALAGTWGGVARNSYYTRVPDGHVRFVLGDLDVELRAETYTRSTPYVNNFNAPIGDFDVPNRERDRFLGLHARYERPLSPSTAFRARLEGDLYDYEQETRSSAAEDCADGQVNGCTHHVHGASRWLTLDTELKLDWLSGLGLVTIAGAEGRVRRVESSIEFQDAQTGLSSGLIGAYGHTEPVGALYVQQEAQPFSWLGANAGLRLDADPRVGLRLTPRAALTVLPAPGSVLKVIYAEAFRTPTAYELYYFDPNSQIVSQGLRPEVVRSLEASVEQRFGAGRLFLNLFRSWWYDLVLLQQITPAELAAAIDRGEIQVGTSAAAQYQNVATLENWGGSVAWTTALGLLRGGLSVTASHTLRRSTDDQPALPLPVSPQVFGNAHLAYPLGAGGAVLALAASYIGMRPADRAFDGGFQPRPEAPPQVDLRLTASGPLSLVPGLSYRASIDWAAAGSSAYVAGPVQAATVAQPSAALAPVNRLRLALLLQQAIP